MPLPPPALTPPAFVERLQRVEARVEEVAELGQQRVGELETAEIRLSGRHAEVVRELSGVKTEGNNLRLSFESRQTRTGRMLELLLLERKIEVPA